MKNQSVLDDLVTTPNIDKLYYIATTTNNECHWWYIAKNPKCPEELLYKFSKSSLPFVREVVAQNTNITFIIFDQLYNDSSLCVRVAVASNPNCPENILLKLFIKELELRKYIVQNEKFLTTKSFSITPQDLVSMLKE